MAAITVSPRGPRHATEVGRMLGSETAKGLRILWSHKPTLVPQFAMLAVMYLLYQLVLGGGRLVDGLLPETLFAFSVYMISYIALLKTVGGLLEEVNAGTLEQTHLSPMRPWQLSAGRLSAVLVEGLLTAVLVSGAFVLVLGIEVPLRPAALVPLAVTLADIAGFALLFGGLALVVNSIGAIIHVINGVVLIVNGSVVPVTAFPHSMEIAARFVPTTLGIDATRQILFDGQTLAAVWADGSLAWALGHAAGMLLAGWTIYQAAIRRGLRDGRLGP